MTKMAKSESVNNKIAFKFKIPAKLAQEQKSIYAPPFATASNMFWQLKFHPESKDHKDYCALWLIAIPNEEEKYSAETWSTRGEYSVTYFMKNPNEKSDFGKLKNYNAKSPVWGFSKFCKKDRLPQEGEITIGVRFNKVQYESERITKTLPSQQFPSELTKAWRAELNQSEISDVQFNFTNCEGTKCQTLYARSSILSERSVYFNSMFQQGKWSETMKDIKNKPQNRLMERFRNELYRKLKYKIPESSIYLNTTYSQKILKSIDSTKLKKAEDEEASASPPDAEEEPKTSSTFKKLPLANIEKNLFNKTTLSQNNVHLEVSPTRNPNVSKKYTVTISDFHPDTFKSMLRFLYTDQIDFFPSSQYRKPIDIFKIADKYLITDLRNRAKTKIFKDLTPESAIEMLFGTDMWLWDDLREVIMTYVVRKFDEIKEIESFKEICAKLKAHEEEEEEEEGERNENNSGKEDVDIEESEDYKDIIMKRELLREILEKVKNEVSE